MRSCFGVALVTRLDDLAERLALARSSLIRLAIIKYLEKPEPPRPD